TNAECLYATGIPLQELMRSIKQRVHSDRVIIILDACHSGAASAESKGLFRSGNVDANQIMAGTGQLVIASSEPNQVSWEGKTYENSVFTRHLIESLKVKGSQIPLGTAFEEMKERVREEVLRDRGQLQTPEFKSQWSGDELLLSIKPIRPRPGIPIESLNLVPATDTTTTSVSTSKSPAQTPVIPPKTVFDNGNIFRVYNQPTRPTRFSTDAKSLLTYLFTYHWNDGKGAAPGLISIRHNDGRLYGPWQSQGKSGQGNVPNAYWECEPMVEIVPGTYTVIDSNPATWAQNQGSGGCGFARVKVVPRQETASSLLVSRLKQEPVTKIFDNGNIYLVYNKPKGVTSFSIDAPVLVTSVTNYHWNDGKGQDPGNITLVHQDGTVYGPWHSTALAGQGNAPNVYWRCSTNALLKAGLYSVLDSDPDTWSHNRQSSGAGITEIHGVYQDR
ncbi:MAG: caspase family protein, partial [Candidatus Obscuribacterales bacterium]|nr:caspase family protein [Candidatus Obscuribacterales bacterium]